MHFLQAINSDLSVLIVCNKTGGTIKRRYKKNLVVGKETARLLKVRRSSVNTPNHTISSSTLLLLLYRELSAPNAITTLQALLLSLIHVLQQLRKFRDVFFLSVHYGINGSIEARVNFPDKI